MITKIQFTYQRSVKNGGECGKLERIMSYAKRAAVVSAILLLHVKMWDYLDIL